MSLPPGYRIETVRGEVGDDLAEELVSFWTGHGALDRDRASERAPQVICVLRDGEGSIRAVNSAFEDRVRELGGKHMWVYRTFAPGPDADAVFEPMFRAATDALEQDFGGRGVGPFGLCVLGVQAPEGVDPLEAVWPESRLLLAGHREDGQVRLRYFDDPDLIGFEYDLHSDCRIVPLADAPEIDEAAIVAMWLREGALSREDALARATEVQLVAVTPDGELAGVSTAYLAYNEHLRARMWHVRVFVAGAHRTGGLATYFNYLTREHLLERYTSGTDVRGPGIVLEVENMVLEDRFPWAVWPVTDFVFVGRNPAGAFVRVLWFPGARLPAT